MGINMKIVNLLIMLKIITGFKLFVMRFLILINFLCIQHSVGQVVKVKIISIELFYTSRSPLPTPLLNPGPNETTFHHKCIQFYYILFGNETIPTDQHTCIVRLLPLIVIYIFNFSFSPQPICTARGETREGWGVDRSILYYI